MKNRCICLLLLTLMMTSSAVQGQNLTGIWRGYFYTEGGDQYKYEVQINHTKAGLEGVTYSYLDTRFYGKATLTGNFNRTSTNAMIQETKTVEVRMSGSSLACIMNCMLTYSKSGREEFLEGTFTSKYETSNAAFGITRGTNCGGGKVYLRKVPMSDFYPEPFLNKTPPARDTESRTTAATPPKSATPNRTPPKTSTASKPPVKNTTGSTPQKNTTAKVPAKTPTPGTAPTISRPKLDTVATTQKQTPVFENKNPERKIASTPLITRERKNELTRTLTVFNEEIEIRLYDNGEIDDDTISVYLDGKLILGNKRLSDKPIIYKLKMSEDEPEHTLVMVAENMGRIPPNTSLMIVQDGDKRYQVSITSTEQKNAMVRFRYEKNDTRL